MERHSLLETGPLTMPAPPESLRKLQAVVRYYAKQHGFDCRLEYAEYCISCGGDRYALEIYRQDRLIVAFSYTSPAGRCAHIKEVVIEHIQLTYDLSFDPTKLGELITGHFASSSSTEPRSVTAGRKLVIFN